MSEINFCSFCDAPQHKLMMVKGTIFYCKQCSRFFSLKEEHFKCPKCDKTNIAKSDFPAPGGDPIFQCRHCKKMFPMSQMLEQE